MKNFLRSIPGKVVLYITFTLLSLVVIFSTLVAVIANEGELYTRTYDDAKNAIIEYSVLTEMRYYAMSVLYHTVGPTDCDVPMKITTLEGDLAAENKTQYVDLNLPGLRVFEEVVTYVHEENDFGGYTEYIEFGNQNLGTPYQVTAYYLPGMYISPDSYFCILVLDIVNTYKIICYPIGIVALLLMILTFVALMSVSAHTSNKEELTPGYFTKLPIEVMVILTAVFSTLAILAFVMLFDYASSMEYFPALVAVGVISSVVVVTSCALFASTIAARIKLKTLAKSSILISILRAIWNLTKRITKAIIYAFSNMKLLWKVALIILGILFVDLIILTAAAGEFEVAMFLWFIEKVILVTLIFYITNGLVKLQKAGDAIASGNTDYEINYKHLHMDFKKHADNLKSINLGIQNAITSKLRSEHMKTELITNVSHDIKTPLTSIINYAGLISNEKSDNPKISEYSEVLVKQSDKLKRLIEDLVEASKANTGNLEVNPVPVDAGTILMQASGEYEEKLQTANLTLVTNQPDHEIMINADPRRMWRVFDNLMNNICKYSLPGSRVYLDLIETESQAIFTFKNTSKEALNITPDELMERFVRGDKSRNTEGNGLGLSIAKSLTELQNGTLDLNIDGDLFKATLTFPKI